MAITEVKGSVWNSNENFIGVNVKDFGATGDGVTNDTTAIQNAIDTGLDVIFPQGVYIVTPNSLTVTQGGQKLVAQPSAYTGTLGNEGPELKTTGAGTIIKVQTPQVIMSGLGFRGDDTAGSIGVNPERIDSNTDDMDFFIFDCRFRDLETCIKHVGRGLTCDRNLFVSVQQCVSISWPTSGTSGTGDQALPFGFRAFRITGNRAHSVNNLVETTGADRNVFRAALITDNQLDIGGILFRGGIINSIIANNVVESAPSTTIFIDAGGDGNTIDGNILTGREGDTSRSPARGIWFQTGAAVKNNTITGNRIQYTDNEGILFDDGAEACAVVGNVIADAGLVASSAACVRIDDVGTDCNISDNEFDTTAVRNGINADAATLTRCTFLGNRTGTTTLLAGTITDGGGNVVQDRERVAINSLDTVRQLSVVGTVALPAKIQRTGSTAAVGTEYVNDAGSFGIFGDPTGSNAGAFVPAGSGTVDLGSASNQWGNAFIGGDITMNTATPTFILQATGAADDITINYNDSSSVNRAQWLWDESGEAVLVRAKDSGGATQNFMQMRLTNTRFGKALRLVDGTVTAPAYSFEDDDNTGIYRSGTDAVSIATNGVQGLQVTSSQRVRIGNGGTVGSPQLSPVTDTDTGINYPAANQVGFVTNGAQRVLVEDGIFTYSGATSAQLKVLATTGVADSILVLENSAGGDWTIRLDDSDSDVLNYRWNNTTVFSRRTGGQNRAVDGIVTVPAYSFLTDSNTGLYLVGTDNPGIATDGALRVDFNATRANFTTPVELESYTVAGVPAATGITGAMVYITDEVGGAVPAFSDGTNWRRVTDRAIIST